MLTRIATFVAGRSLARTAGGLGGTAATAAALVLPMVLRRLGPGGMIAAAVAGHVVRRAARRGAARR